MLRDFGAYRSFNADCGFRHAFSMSKAKKAPAEASAF
jgi:hypothetical protein